MKNVPFSAWRHWRSFAAAVRVDLCLCLAQLTEPTVDDISCSSPVSSIETHCPQHCMAHA